MLYGGYNNLNNLDMTERHTQTIIFKVLIRFYKVFLLAAIAIRILYGTELHTGIIPVKFGGNSTQ